MSTRFIQGTPVNYQGRTNTGDRPAGYIGERITWATPPSGQAATTSITDWTNSSIVLTPGTWHIHGSFFVTLSTVASAGATATLVINVTDALNNVVQNMDSQAYIKTPAATATMDVGLQVAMHGVVSIDTTTTYKVRIFKVETAATCQIYNSNNGRSMFYAIRIA